MLSARRCAHPWRLVICAAVASLGYLTSHCLPDWVPLTVGRFCTPPSSSIQMYSCSRLKVRLCPPPIEAAAGTGDCLALGFWPGLLALEWENSMMYPPVRAVAVFFLAASTCTRSLPCSPSQPVLILLQDD